MKSAAIVEICFRRVEYAAAYFTGEICDGVPTIVLPYVMPFSIVIPFHQSIRYTCSAATVSSAATLAEAEALAKVATWQRLLAHLVHVIELTTILSNELKS